MTDAVLGTLSKVFIAAMLIILMLLILLNIVRGATFRNMIKYTSRIDDMNNTLVSYAQKNGGINATTPEFEYSNINELKLALLDVHGLNGNVIESPDDVVITQTSDPALRGSMVTVTTKHKLPMFKINWLRGKTEWVDATPRVAEGIVHKYQK